MNPFTLLKWALTLGREPQNFLGAKWLLTLLKRAPEKSKPIWALRILSLSPHYFFIDSQSIVKNESRDDYLKRIFHENLTVREQLCALLLAPRMTPDSVVLDYGCGPGYFAKASANRVRKIFACDISDGALACARVLNSSPNIEYLAATDEGLAAIPDSSIDLAYSFAVIQHVTDDVFAIILKNCATKLKSGGKLIFHVVCDDPAWRSEEEWRADKSVKGKLKFKYGLHCFSRPQSGLSGFVAQHGFSKITIAPVAELAPENLNDICRQHLLCAVKE